MIYGINIAVAGFWAAVQWWYATRDHLLIDHSLEPNFITRMSRRGVIDTIIYLTKAAMSFASTTVSLVMFIVIPIYYLTRFELTSLGFGLLEINKSPKEFDGSETEWF